MIHDAQFSIGPDRTCTAIQDGLGDISDPPGVAQVTPLHLNDILFVTPKDAAIPIQLDSLISTSQNGVESDASKPQYGPETDCDVKSLGLPFHADDLDDLLEPWVIEPMPPLTTSIELPTPIQHVLGFSFQASGEDETLYIYTDGSFAATGDHAGNTWAFVVFAICDVVFQLSVIGMLILSLPIGFMKRGLAFMSMGCVVRNPRLSCLLVFIHCSNTGPRLSRSSLTL